MQASPVLVLSNQLNAALFEALSRRGYAAVFLRAPDQALQRLRQEPFSAVVLEAEPEGMDILELLLTVRDFVGSVPVVVIGVPNDGPLARALRIQQDTLLLNRSVAQDRLAGEIHRMIQTHRASRR